MTSFNAESALVVDDSGTIRAILKDMLARLGFRSIEEADSGEAALALLQTRGFSLVVCDWNMGGMSGLDLLRASKSIRQRGQNRFIFATSERSWGHQTSAKDCGADAFITKPFNLATLKTKVDQVLAR